MGVSAAALGGDRGSSAVLQVAGGLAAWLCGFAAIAIAVSMIAVLARAGWQDIVWVFASTSDAGIASALGPTALLLALALPASLVTAFLAGAAASDPAIGGRTASLIDAALRFGPSIPSVALGASVLAVIANNPGLEQAAGAHPIAAAALALVVLNVPIMTARFRFAFRSVPRKWRLAAVAAGAAPAAVFFGVIVPRAASGIAAVALNGAGQMVGETALVAMVLSVSHGVSAINHALTFAPATLSVHLWQRLAVGYPDLSSAPAAASEALLLVGAIVVPRFIARLLLRRRRRSGAIA